MKNRRHEQHKMQESLRERTNNSIMGTYLILGGMNAKMCGCKIKVTPWHSPTPGSVFLQRRGLRHQGRKAESLDSTVKDAYAPRQPGREDRHSPSQHGSKEDDHLP